MHRFFIPPEECHNTPLRLGEAEAKHARSVLRLREGDRVVVLNGAGKELLCQADEVRSDSTTLKIIQENSIAPLPFEITLYQAVTKGKTMDLIIQKATELGAHRVDLRRAQVGARQRRLLLREAAAAQHRQVEQPPRLFTCNL